MMNKAIFLDRDGVINKERGFTYRLQDFEILPDVFETLKIFRDNGFLLVIVTNQSGVAKELYKRDDVEIIHKNLLEEFKKQDIVISEIYYCLHHPDVSRCICRKPDSLFIEKALSRFNIDPEKSFFIGDKERDVLASKKANVKGFLIEANTPLKNLLPQILK